MSRTLLIALLGLAIPLSAASPEYLVGGAAPALAPLMRGGPSVATDGTDYFVAWSDARSGTNGIVGTRMKRDGQVLEPLGIRISGAPGLASPPQVVWDGGAYLVLWSESEGDHHDFTKQRLYAVRINRDGALLMARRVIAEDATSTGGTFAASNGNVTVIGYLSRKPGSFNENRIVALDRDGNTLHDELLTKEPTFRRGFAIAASGSRFVAAWDSNTGYSAPDAEVKAVPLNAAGRVIDTPVTVGRGEWPVIASDGTGFLIVGNRYTSSEAFPIRTLESHVVSADLKTIGAAQDLVSGYSVNDTSLIWRGDRYEVNAGWRATPDMPYELAAIEVGPGGNKVSAGTRGTLDESFVFPQLAAATNGGDLLLTLVSSVDWDATVSARLYRGNALTADTSMLLSWSGNTHAQPSVASSPSGQFVAWSEAEGVYATRVDRQGRTLDGRGIRLATKSGQAATSFDGTNYVVAWTDDTGSISVRYITPATGAAVANVRVPAAIGEGIALVESPEATFLVYHGDERIRVARIPYATHTPDPVPLAVSPDGMLVASPAAAWNGATLLVAWNELILPPDHAPSFTYPSSVYAARVTAGLSLVDPVPLPVIAGPERVTHSVPSVASNGQDWLVVADLYLRPPGAAPSDVLARRVSANGTFPGVSPVVLAAGFAPVVTWDGTRYVAAWKEGDLYEGREHPVNVAIVSATGTPEITRLAPVTPNATPGALSMVPAENGAVAIAYTKVSFLPEHTGVDRSFFRVMDFAPRGRPVRR